LLQSLVETEFPSDVDVHVVVLDNDCEASAQEIAAQFSELLPGLTYDKHCERGYAAVRNKLIQKCRVLKVEYLVFVDDDEWVTKRWLSTLVSTSRQYNCDAVAGPVIPEFEKGTPSWILHGEFFRRPRFTTGTEVKRLGIGNVMIRMAWFEDHAEPFNRAFDTIGGEDSELLNKLYRGGLKMIWCEEASVWEFVPRERTTVSSLLGRAYRNGYADAVRESLARNTLHWRCYQMVRSIGAMAQGVLLTAPGIV